jgi:hypothetical protein
VVVGKSVPQTQPDQLGDFLLLVYRRRFVLAAHVLERRFRPRLERRRAFAPTSKTTQFFV